ncbi:DNA modification methylase [Microbacterium sp. Sa4CUA7]|uniref:DNA modification methylase n=1 Tax=Microbacterium pullorum TaxID=2762236 RepID=A0ABR8RZ35_9MICO|nr:DNA modification methylase [Microbacterium pullorum]MBD7956344.1 DNA modification methylase [Microbacterium pullorum]
MKSRLLASLALGAAVVLGATGCSIISPQATTIPYSPSDGVNVPDSGPVDVLNAMVIANEDGSAGNFIAALVNNSLEQQVVVIALEGGAAEIVTLAGGESVSLGVDEDPILFTDLGFAPGATAPMAFQSGDGEGVVAEIPVLDGALPYYSEFVPVEDEFIED